MAHVPALQPFESLRHDLGRVFGEVSRLLRPSREEAAARPPFPPVNLHADDLVLFVEALVPGVAPEELEVTVVGDTLVVAGERFPPAAPADARVHRSERIVGRFTRTVRLPEETGGDEIAARYWNGILLLTIARPAEAAAVEEAASEASGES